MGSATCATLENAIRARGSCGRVGFFDAATVAYCNLPNPVIHQQSVVRPTSLHPIYIKRFATYLLSILLTILFVLIPRLHIYHLHLLTIFPFTSASRSPQILPFTICISPLSSSRLASLWLPQPHGKFPPCNATSQDERTTLTASL